MLRETADISGMGGPYEAECQRMLWRGVAYLDRVQPSMTIWDGAASIRGVTGVLFTEGEGLKALEAAAIPPGTDCTGAMHQYVMSHLRYIHAHGVDAWLAHFTTTPGRIYRVNPETGARARRAS